MARGHPRIQHPPTELAATRQRAKHQVYTLPPEQRHAQGRDERGDDWAAAAAAHQGHPIRGTLAVRDQRRYSRDGTRRQRR
eukprot:3934563-Prymnesium_polylepis.1